MNYLLHGTCLAVKRKLHLLETYKSCYAIAKSSIFLAFLVNGLANGLAIETSHVLHGVIIQ